ncbi:MULTISPECIES: PAS domain-containing protein [unclassified Phenylobacterium]|uniref:PAS domain-containing protein n=1 Tax=unclassified Phenylobacterium TaxID=2640670 RepID=UPI00083B7D36|nr:MULTISPECIES: PAS domain-containing protein [unclassified Phenylobacterium]
MVRAGDAGLRVSSALLERVARDTPCLVGVSDPEFRLLFINDYGRRMTGLSAEADLSALSLSDLFQPGDREIVRDVALPTLLRDGVWEGVYDFHHFAGGDSQKVKWDLFVLRDEAGEMIGAGCLTKDLTQRLDAERKLRSSQGRLKAASDLVGLSSYAWDPRSGLLEWDDRLKTLWGVPAGVEPDEALWMEGVHPDDREAVQAAIDRAVDPAGDGVYDIQYRVLGLQGRSERWVHTHGQTQFQDGEAVAFTGAVLDITDQKRAETLLRRSEEQYRRFAENTADVLWIVNVDVQQLAYLSPGFELACGLPPDVAMADMRAWTDCIHPEDRAARLQTLQRVAEGGETITHEYRILRPDGVVRRLRDTTFPIRDAEGHVLQIGGIAHDISHRSPLGVYVVGTDRAAREKRAADLRRAGHRVTTFATESAFLDVALALESGCVLVRTDDASASRFALAPDLRQRRADLRLIYETGLDEDVDMAIRAMKSGAVDVLSAPAGIDAVLAAVALALADLREDEREDRAGQMARNQIALMSQRERDVLEGLLRGGTNKTIARELGISPRTVETHRAGVMERLGAHTVPEAVLAAAAAGLRPLRSRSD